MQCNSTTIPVCRIVVLHTGNINIFNTTVYGNIIVCLTRPQQCKAHLIALCFPDIFLVQHCNTKLSFSAPCRNSTVLNSKVLSVTIKPTPASLSSSVVVEFSHLYNVSNMLSFVSKQYQMSSYCRMFQYWFSTLTLMPWFSLFPIH